MVGAPIPRAEIDAFGRNARGLMTHLRHRTYALSPSPIPTGRLGYEFEAKSREPRPVSRDERLGATPMPARGL